MTAENVSVNGEMRAVIFVSTVAYTLPEQRKYRIILFPLSLSHWPCVLCSLELCLPLAQISLSLSLSVFLFVVATF